MTCRGIPTTLSRATSRTSKATLRVVAHRYDDDVIDKLVYSLATHPRFRMHFTPVHCSWMNQVEQWFSILQRKRLRAPNFADLADLEDKILAFIVEWNEIADPFNWTTKSFDKILKGADNPGFGAARTGAMR
jgi:hypothetical protein